MAELGYRLTGSSDLYERDGRRPSASINFVTAHDGFTLHDLVSYNEKHNEANGEDNRDGTNGNYSWNHGVEGETDDERINTIRDREKRNFLTTMLISQGVPMICGGDEIDRTQGGNNNAYDQDNEISWLDWNLDDGRKALLGFTAALIDLRKKHPNLRRRKFFQDRKISPATAEMHKVGDQEIRDICWYRPDGEEMTEDEWNAGWVRCLGLRLSGRTLNDVDRYGELMHDDTFLFCLNPHHEPIKFYTPACSGDCSWEVLVDTQHPSFVAPTQIKPKEPYQMAEHSGVLFREVEIQAAGEDEADKEMRKRHTVELKHEHKEEVPAK